MNTIAFDTHSYIKKLKAVGFTEEQAEVQAEALRESQATSIENLATKADLMATKVELKLEISRLEGEIKLIKWMIGVMLAGVISLVLKAFFM